MYDANDQNDMENVYEQPESITDSPPPPSPPKCNNSDDYLIPTNDLTYYEKTSVKEVRTGSGPESPLQGLKLHGNGTSGNKTDIELAQLEMAPRTPKDVIIQLSTSNVQRQREGPPRKGNKWFIVSIALVVLLITSLVVGVGILLHTNIKLNESVSYHNK